MVTTPPSTQGHSILNIPLLLLSYHLITPPPPPLSDSHIHTIPPSPPSLPSPPSSFLSSSPTPSSHPPPPYLYSTHSISPSSKRYPSSSLPTISAEKIKSGGRVIVSPILKLSSHDCRSPSILTGHGISSALNNFSDEDASICSQDHPFQFHSLWEKNFLSLSLSAQDVHKWSIELEQKSVYTISASFIHYNTIVTPYCIHLWMEWTLHIVLTCITASLLYISWMLHTSLFMSIFSHLLTSHTSDDCSSL